MASSTPCRLWNADTAAAGPLEGHTAASAGLLTERTQRSLARAPTRHGEAEEPGELTGIDTFYIGKLKGVGKLWQVTACDVASPYAIAKGVSACSAAEAAAFLRHVVLTTLTEAGWRLQHVLTDGGSEFKGEFDVACRELSVRHTPAKPRHAWTNGFVERLQQTIIHEHWRIALRQRYFRKGFQLQASLERFLPFYSFGRLHQGHRTRGRTPAEVLWGAISHEVHQEVRRASTLTTLDSGPVEGRYARQHGQPSCITIDRSRWFPGRDARI